MNYALIAKYLSELLEQGHAAAPNTLAKEIEAGRGVLEDDVRRAIEKFPAPVIVLVSGGVAEEFAPRHVDVRIVDHDNIEAGDAPPTLPRGVGFEDLVRRAGQAEGEDFTWEK